MKIHRHLYKLEIKKVLRAFDPGEFNVLFFRKQQTPLKHHLLITYYFAKG